MTEKRRLTIEIRGGDCVYIKEDPKYPFCGRRVKIEATGIDYIPTRPWQRFVVVEDIKLSIAAINRNQPLIRDGHRTTLRNKELVINP